MFHMTDDGDESGDHTEEHEQRGEGQQAEGLLHHAVLVNRTPDQVEGQHTRRGANQKGHADP